MSSLLFLNLKAFLFLPMLMSLVQSCIRFRQCSLTRPPFQGVRMISVRVLHPVASAHETRFPPQLRLPAQTDSCSCYWIHRKTMESMLLTHQASTKQTDTYSGCIKTNRARMKHLHQGPSVSEEPVHSGRADRQMLLFFCSVQQVLWRLHIHMTCFVNLEGALTSPYTQLGAGG